MAVFAARQAMARRILSRPAVAPDGSVRGEIPLADGEWHQLQHLAAALANGASTPTAGQVAAALLRLGLVSPNLDAVRQELQSQAAPAANPPQP